MLSSKYSSYNRTITVAAQYEVQYEVRSNLPIPMDVKISQFGALSLPKTQKLGVLACKGASSRLDKANKYSYGSRAQNVSKTTSSENCQAALKKIL